MRSRVPEQTCELPGLVVEDSPAAADVAPLEERAAAAASAAAGCGEEQEFAIFARGDNGQVVAGSAGIVWGGYCELHAMWVEESLRNRGLGRALVAGAEAEARRRGCALVVFRAHDLLARGLYDRLGYETVGDDRELSGGKRRALVPKPYEPSSPSKAEPNRAPSPAPMTGYATIAFLCGTTLQVDSCSSFRTLATSPIGSEVITRAVVGEFSEYLPSGIRLRSVGTSAVKSKSSDRLNRATLSDDAMVSVASAMIGCVGCGRPSTWLPSRRAPRKADERIDDSPVIAKDGWRPVGDRSPLVFPGGLLVVTIAADSPIHHNRSADESLRPSASGLTRSGG